MFPGVCGPRQFQGCGSDLHLGQIRVFRYLRQFRPVQVAALKVHSRIGAGGIFAQNGIVANAIQEEADRYLARLTQLAYAEGLPRVVVNLYRLVVVPRQLLNGVARQCLAARLRREPALTGLESQPLKDFFCLQLVRDMDAAITSVQPTVKRPFATGHGWATVGLNTEYVWFAAVEDSRWAGHHFAFELPRDPISRAMRKAIEEAMKTFDSSLPVLSRVERNDILRRAWPAELLHR